ncbi:hypothetical protein Tco_0605710 [Tanacetum coccineum]
MPPSSNPYHRSSTSTSSSVNKTEFYVNPTTQVIKILESIEEQKLSQGFSVLLDYLFPKEANFYKNDFQTRQYYEAILLDSGSVQIRHNYSKTEPEKIEFTIFKLPWILSFTHKKKEAEGTSPPLLIRQFSVKWWKQINEEQANKEAVIRYYNSLIQESPSTSTIKTNSASKLSKENRELAQKVKDFENDEEFLRLMNHIRSSPTPSEDLFQDSQDPYDSIDLL